MFVPSLSWQNDRFYIPMAQTRLFPAQAGRQQRQQTPRLQRDARPRYVQASATARLLFVRRRSCLTRNCFYFSVWRHDTLSQQQGDFQFPMANYTTSVVGNVSIEWITKVVGESKATPFFAYVAPKAAHEPFNPAPWYRDHWCGKRPCLFACAPF
jgi:hypothetical protein